MFQSISIYESLSILLLLIFFFLGFKILESKWSYKLSKPWKWEDAVNKKQVSTALIHIENNYRDKVRFYTFWFQIERLKQLNIPGDFAELGVYKGETARMIHEMDASRILHLFDTFEGFHADDLIKENNQDTKYNSGNFSDTNLSEVKSKFTSSTNIRFHQGYFPETTREIPKTTFAFVHLDADLYLPTLNALNYFYPKLSQGGIIMIHDYNHTWPGVKKALDEFVKGIPESIVELSDWQGSALLIKANIVS